MGLICKGLLFNYLPQSKKHLLIDVAIAFPSCCFPYDSWNMVHSFLLVPKNGSRITQGALSILRNRAPLSELSLMALDPRLRLLGKAEDIESIKASAACLPCLEVCQ